MGASIATTFPPGGVNVASNYDRPGLPGAGALDPFFMEAIRRKMALDEQMQQERLNQMRRAGQVSASAAAPERENPMAALTRGAGAQAKRPVFTKTVGGPGMQGGTIRLNQWEPGAAYAGDEADLGSGPERSTFQPGGTETPASLGGHGAPLNAATPPDLNESETADRVAAERGGGGGGGSPFEQARMKGALDRSNDEYAHRQEVADAQRKALLRSLGLAA
jgi:hypothetical protein